MGGLLGVGGGGAKSMLPPPVKLLAGPAPPSPLFLHLCFSINVLRHERQYGSIRELAHEIKILITYMQTIRAQAQLGLVDSNCTSNMPL